MTGDESTAQGSSGHPLKNVAPFLAKTFGWTAGVAAFGAVNILVRGEGVWFWVTGSLWIPTIGLSASLLVDIEGFVFGRPPAHRKKENAILALLLMVFLIALVAYSGWINAVIPVIMSLSAPVVLLIHDVADCLKNLGR